MAPFSRKVVLLLRGTFRFYRKEVWGNNRSVMPLDVLGRTRATLMHSTSLQPWLRGLGNLLNVHRDGDRLLQLLIFNEEFLVNASHQLALITSLPFVHTARRTYRLSFPVRYSDLGSWRLCLMFSREVSQILKLRGRWSRNKVAVGEPAAGSFLIYIVSVFFKAALYPTPTHEQFSLCEFFLGRLCRSTSVEFTGPTTYSTPQL